MFASSMCFSFHYVHVSLSGGKATIDPLPKGRQQKNVKNFYPLSSCFRSRSSSLGVLARGRGPPCQRKSCSQRNGCFTCRNQPFPRLFTPLLLTLTRIRAVFDVQFAASVPQPAARIRWLLSARAGLHRASMT